MVINHNLSADFATRVNNMKNTSIRSSIQKLSSGLKINNAGDDAAGLAISEKMRAQIRGMQRASSNVQEAYSFIETAEGYLAESNDVLLRIRELSIQAANGINSGEDIELINAEIDQLVQEIDRVARDARFNEKPLFIDGGSSISFHVGPNPDQNISATIGDTSATALGLLEEGEQIPSLSILDTEDANRVIGRADSALKAISSQRAELGAIQSRFSYLQQGLEIGTENLQAAESSIRDTDMATEVSTLVKNQILAQSSLAMLAQANTNPQSILSLLN